MNMNRRPIFEKIGQTVVPVSEKPRTESQRKISAEKSAEELWALWHDFRRLQLKKDKSDSEKLSEQTLLAAVTERWRNPNVRQIVEATLKKELRERDKMTFAVSDYNEIKKHRDENEKRRLELFRFIFKSGGDEAPELEQIELAELEAQIDSENNRLITIEAGDSELAARLSFERLRRYQRELSNGFIWTPSRYKYFNQLLQRAITLNQNRPILMYGESGTGKTRLIREAAKRLTGEAPFEVGEEAKTDIRPLLGSKKIEALLPNVWVN